MYEHLSSVYDKFMSADYDEWAEFVISRNVGNRGCDVGCGSGLFTVAMARKGYRMHGCDISAQMLNRARDNARRVGVNVDWSMQDASKMKLAGKVDFVTAICDVVNYIKSPKDFFACAYEALVPGGKLIFDVSTEYKLQNILDGRTFSESDDDATYIWSNYFDKRYGRLNMYLTFFTREGELFRRSEERQVQYAHCDEKICRMLNEVGFEVFRVGDDLVHEPGGKDSRIFYIATKGG